jgi:hypothetical protein
MIEELGPKDATTKRIGLVEEVILEKTVDKRSHHRALGN